MRNLIIVGGPFHPPETQAPSLVAILASMGIESAVEDDVGDDEIRRIRCP
jgi:hypothetical protein